MDMIHQCKAMIPPRNYAPWSSLVVAGGNGTWSSEKNAWYVSSSSTNKDVYTNNYLFDKNWINLEPGEYRLECSVDSNDGQDIRVLAFICSAIGNLDDGIHNYYDSKKIDVIINITSDKPWYCMRFGTRQYSQTVYLHWCRLTKLS